MTSWRRERALGQKCPKCGAEPSALCRDLRSRHWSTVARNFHPERADGHPAVRQQVGTNEDGVVTNPPVEPMPREWAGRRLALTVTLAYPGSRVSDILIGDFKFQVPNRSLKEAMLMG